jgi:hypothetical protein
MDADSIAKINQVADAVLERCAGSPLPHSVLRDIMKEIEASGTLTAEELAAVDSAVRRSLDSH